ncbi:unnamed protein product [Notodromas monacha]|uniref:alpha-1,2-Mannosidase n=1 Tax=Notodromas monacha TaxID=399045 RepID=A0A7R9BH95_9CRUS|nr:unnamed protein product [Notodromas monacha]CAG0915466.1 unnamed protein product [Notodromas monacha]
MAEAVCSNGSVMPGMDEDVTRLGGLDLAENVQIDPGKIITDSNPSQAMDFSLAEYQEISTADRVECTIPEEKHTLSETDVRSAANVGNIEGRTDSAVSTKECSSQPFSEVQKEVLDPGLPQSPDKLFESPIEDSTLFNQVSYLGVAACNAPRSEVEITRSMIMLNHEKPEGDVYNVSIKIPHANSGTVVIYDGETQAEIRRFPVSKIIFCVKGGANTADAACFAFTCMQGDNKESALFQCHVLRCHIPEAVPKVMRCFELAFKRTRPKDVLDGNCISLTDPSAGESGRYTFEVFLEELESVDGNFYGVPKDKNFFKLRCDTDKRVHMTVQEITNGNRKELGIERCFGLLISPGKHVRDGDMQLLEMVSSTESTPDGKQQLVITGHWDSSDSAFELLNVETQLSSLVFMSVAVDLVLCGILVPVRFTIETAAKIYPKRERFWYVPRKQLIKQFVLTVKATEPSSSGEPRFEVVDLSSAGEQHKSRNLMNLNLNSLSNFASSALAGAATAATGRNSVPGTPDGFDDDSDWDDDDDEPVMSGSGEVSKECTEAQLTNWGDVLSDWKAQKHDFLPPFTSETPKVAGPNGTLTLSRRVRRSKIPRQLLNYVKDGIPDPLRGEIWQLLAGCDADPEMLDNYRVLIAQPFFQEQVIERDISRTFPGHDFFKDRRGSGERGINGQEALLKVCKAVSVYDKEVGYCQGLSFLAAALLLHMPEEQAFALLVKILFDYGLRDLFVDDFQLLHIRFHQLDGLIQEHLPDLAAHLKEEGVESHMFASQWFLTLFTAKFPLYLVFHMLDLFLLCGLDTTFQVALALLSAAKKDLLSADFEGILRYFRTGLPRRYHKSEEFGRHLIHLAGTFKLKKLEKYERQYYLLAESSRNIDPTILLKKENHRLMEDNLRLEREIDRLVMEKIQLSADLDTVHEKIDTLSKNLKGAEEMLADTEDEKKRMETEAARVKEMFKKEMLKWERENSRNLRIIEQYKLAAAGDAEENCVTDSTDAGDVNGVDDDGDFYKNQVRELELSLAQTKVALVEEQCKNQMMVHAWRNYAEFAWGENELRPVTRTGHSAGIFGKSKLGATIVDAMDTLYIMGLSEEFEEGRKWIQSDLTLEGLNTYISVFETNIRFVGGLLSCYALTGDEMFKEKAVHIADKLLPAFNSPSGIPYALVNTATGASRNYAWASGSSSILSEVGTLHLEFAYLSNITGNVVYKEKVEHVRDVLKDAPKSKGLYPNYVSPKTGRFGQNHVSLGALGDSFYEYLLKAWLQSNKTDVVAKTMYSDAMQALSKAVLKVSRSGMYYVSDLKYDRLEHKMDHLACFAGGLYALGAHYIKDSSSEYYLRMGAELTSTCHQSYDLTASKLGPESFRFEGDGKSDAKAIRNSEKYYILRPETIESYFILWRLTKDRKYREWGWEAVQALEEHCRLEHGYSGVKNVYSLPVIHDDVQQSFFLAETLKYLYLLFSDDQLISLDQWVFNTEAHPLPVFGVKSDA